MINNFTSFSSFSNLSFFTILISLSIKSQEVDSSNTETEDIIIVEKAEPNYIDLSNKNLQTKYQNSSILPGRLGS
ncbi:MAG: hypothetical protein R2750_11865 [Bacteroidales bacterium]